MSAPLTPLGQRHDPGQPLQGADTDPDRYTAAPPPPPPLVNVADVTRPPLTTADTGDHAAAVAYLIKHTRATALIVLDAQSGQPKGIVAPGARFLPMHSSIAPPTDKTTERHVQRVRVRFVGD